MSDALDAADLLRFAHLARLSLTHDEANAIARDVSQVLEYVRTLQAVDVDDVSPTTHASAPAGQTRADHAAPGMSLERVLANAPERIGDAFGVPKIIE